MWNIISQIAICLIYLSFIVLGCSATDEATRLTTKQLNFGNESCGLARYNPVCGEDQVTYVSPCFAGCTRMEENEYLNCTKVKRYSGHPEGLARSGACNLDCENASSFRIFLALTCLTHFLSASGAAGSVLVEMR